MIQLTQEGFSTYLSAKNLHQWNGEWVSLLSYVLEYLELVFPRLIEFNPDFILVSAGFDAHEKDFLGSTSFISISEFDYSWVTRELVKISNVCCDGRMISMLEGGYNTDGGGLFSPLGNSIYSHIYELSHGNNQIITKPKDEFTIRKRKFEQISTSSLPVMEATYTR